MNLSQALKQKNRLAGELVRLQNILQRENSRRSDNPSKVDRREIWGKITEISDQLGELKAKIAAANVPIYSKIERMAELKARIAYIQTLSKREGEEVSFIGRDQEKLTYVWSAIPFNQERADLEIGKIQVQIDQYQDAIDTYNSQTPV